MGEPSARFYFFSEPCILHSWLFSNVHHQVLLQVYKVHLVHLLNKSYRILLHLCNLQVELPLFVAVYAVVTAQRIPCCIQEFLYAPIPRRIREQQRCAAADLLWQGRKQRRARAKQRAQKIRAHHCPWPPWHQQRSPRQQWLGPRRSGDAGRAACSIPVGCGIARRLSHPCRSGAAVSILVETSHLKPLMFKVAVNRPA